MRNTSKHTPSRVDSTTMITIQNASSYKELPTETQLETWVSAVLDAEQTSGDICIRFVDEPEIQRLNRDYRQKDRPTNVLSFSFEVPDGIEDHHLGDLVICPSIINQEAKDQEKTQMNHFAHMLVHGTFHLLGYDHLNEADAAIMEAKEIQLLAKLGIDDPYGDLND